MSDTRATLPPRFVLPLLGLFVVLGVTLRLPGIGRSLGHDELYTIVIFASRSWLDILSGYDLPNNATTITAHACQISSSNPDV